MNATRCSEKGCREECDIYASFVALGEKDAKALCQKHYEKKIKNIWG